jgi:hypothetical protein
LLVALSVLALLLLVGVPADRLAVAVAVLPSDDPLEPAADGAAPACRVPAASRNAAARIAPDRCTTGERTSFEVVIMNLLVLADTVDVLPEAAFYPSSTPGTRHA